jgi:hypothetical protein
MDIDRGARVPTQTGGLGGDVPVGTDIVPLTEHAPKVVDTDNQ